MSGKNQVQVASDWLRVWLFGRDIAAIGNVQQGSGKENRAAVISPTIPTVDGNGKN
jgi:hypothetical protein